MPSEIYLIDADGARIYLSGVGRTYTGVGTPWTAQNTSPFKLSMNEVTGNIWTPTAPEPIPIWNGGPPFALGGDLAYQGYDNVSEVVGLQGYAGLFDDAMGLGRLLRRTFGQAIARRPVILAVLPDGGSATVYFEILSARVQELPALINQEARRREPKIVRWAISWVRRPFGGALGGGATLINAVTVGNTGTGSPANISSLGAAARGDLITAGGPLNVRALLPAGVPRELLIGTVAGRTYTANTSSLVTSSTTGVVAATFDALDLSPFLTNSGLSLRIMLRATNVSTNLQVRVRAYAVNTNTPIYTSPWISATTAAASNVLLDMGGCRLPQIYRTSGTLSFTTAVTVDVRSTTGAATTGALGYVEGISAHTWAIASRWDTSGTTSIARFVELSGLPALPIPQRAESLAGTYYGPESLRGVAPLYLPGTSLYLAWRAPGTNVHVTSETATLTVTHAPLYHTLRGAE